MSRSNPSTPSCMKRSCQRQTAVLLLPVRRMISTVPRPSPLRRTICARHTCFCRLFRSATTASRRARSAVLTSTMIPGRMRQTRTQRARRESLAGFNRQILTTRTTLSTAWRVVATRQTFLYRHHSQQLSSSAYLSPQDNRRQTWLSRVTRHTVIYRWYSWEL